jgi:hypothetical protein
LCAFISSTNFSVCFCCSKLSVKVLLLMCICLSLIH